MKRLWIGLTVLSVLLLAGWTSAYFMERCHGPICKDLSLAVQAAAQDDWPKAEALSASAQAQWQRCRDFTAIFADHTVLEEVDSLFAEVAIYTAARENIPFAAACARLSELAKAVSESHSPIWQNLL